MPKGRNNLTSLERLEACWAKYVGRFIIIVNGKRRRIVQVHNEEPMDRSVGIFHGFLDVEVTGGKMLCLCTDGNVYIDGNCITPIGTHNIYVEN